MCVGIQLENHSRVHEISGRLVQSTRLASHFNLAPPFASELDSKVVDNTPVVSGSNSELDNSFIRPKAFQPARKIPGGRPSRFTGAS